MLPFRDSEVEEGISRLLWDDSTFSFLSQQRSDVVFHQASLRKLWQQGADLGWKVFWFPKVSCFKTYFVLTHGV